MTSAWSVTECKFFLADLRDVEGKLKPTLKPDVIPCRKKWTRGLCGWLRSMWRHVERIKGVVMVHALGGTRGASGAPGVTCSQWCSQSSALERGSPGSRLYMVMSDIPGISSWRSKVGVWYIYMYV